MEHFIDENTARGICYAQSTIVNKGKDFDRMTQHAIRFFDKYVKIDGRWWISEREQNFVYTCFPPMSHEKSLPIKYYY